MYITKQGKVTRQAHVALPAGTYEEEHGRQGFFGRASHLYHRNPPTGWMRIVRNSDGDEVHFVHEGRGTLETEYGVIPYEKGDYIVIPRCTTYRVVPEVEENFFLIVEAFSEIVPPTKEMKGLLEQHDLYDMTAISSAGTISSREWRLFIRPVFIMARIPRPWKTRINAIARMRRLS